MLQQGINITEAQKAVQTTNRSFVPLFILQDDDWMIVASTGYSENREKLNIIFK